MPATLPKNSVGYTLYNPGFLGQGRSADNINESLMAVTLPSSGMTWHTEAVFVLMLMTGNSNQWM